MNPVRPLCRGAGLAVALGWALLAGCTPIQPVNPVQPPVVEPLVPTPLALQVESPLQRPAARPTPQPPPPLPDPYTLRWRVGVGVPDGRSPLPYAWDTVRPGWYLNWSVGYTQTLWAGSAAPPALTLDDLAVPADEQIGMTF